MAFPPNQYLTYELDSQIIQLFDAISSKSADSSALEKIGVFFDFIDINLNFYEGNSDELNFGRMQKTNTAEETFYYEYSDCEDLGVLLFRFIQYTTKLPCILIYYKGHVNIGIAFGKKQKGYSIKFLDNHYTIVDPSFGTIGKKYKKRMLAIFPYNFKASILFLK